MLLKRLPSSHPQYIRCRRAASENLKPGFFDGAASYNGINVLDVYKVENKPLLEKFQKCAAMLEPGKVKGLFTSVPAKAVERTVVLGFGALDHDIAYQKPKSWTMRRILMFMEAMAVSPPTTRPWRN